MSKWADIKLSFYRMVVLTSVGYDAAQHTPSGWGQWWIWMLTVLAVLAIMPSDKEASDESPSD